MLFYVKGLQSMPPTYPRQISIKQNNSASHSLSLSFAHQGTVGAFWVGQFVSVHRIGEMSFLYIRKRGKYLYSVFFFFFCH